MKAINFTFSGFNVSLSRKDTQVLHSESVMSRKKAYWLSQISGWSIYAIINLAVIASLEKLTFPKALLILLLCYAGISFTHIYRCKVKKWGWLNLPLKKIIPRVLLSSLVIGTFLFILFFSINIFTGIYEMEEFKAGTPILGVINMSSVILLWSLIYFSVHYLENYKKVEIEALIWEAAVKDFELKTLKSQLNPHFMFNALNSIRALIEEDPQSAQTAVTKLSNILRYSLKIDSTETVSLQEEMQTVSDYLALETIRFEERLKYKIDIDPKSYSVEIPPMMIQTLVENGIKHGVSKRTNGGTILVNTKITDSKLQVQIRNTGHIDERALMNSRGFGINNTKHRLNLLYGEKAFFSIKNYSDDEVITELTIPTGGINK
ncbi:MAG: histidine kinase [Ignavibacteriaceae bacterium]